MPNLLCPKTGNIKGFTSNSKIIYCYYLYLISWPMRVAKKRLLLVEDSGPDVLGKVSDVIAPHGCCAG
jgi:hypothetical protein